MTKINKKLLLLIIIILFTRLQNADAYLKTQPIDENKNLYIYNFNKAISFDSEIAGKFNWLNGHSKYFEYGVIAAGGGRIPTDDTFIKLLDIDYYKRNTSYFYYNISSNTINEFNTLNQNVTIQNYIDIIDKELTKLSPALRAGNAEVSAFFLGVISKYFSNLALWPYAMGEKTAFGAAKHAVIREYFEELDKLIISDNLYKIDNKIEFDGRKEKFDLRDAVVSMIKFTVFDNFNPERFKSMNAITMYNLLPMSDALNKKIILNKNIDSLSGDHSSYNDWENSYIEHIAKTLNYCINYLYELADAMPTLDSRPPVEIAKLKYEPFDRRIKLYWDLNINRRVDRQLVYRWNLRRNVWEFIGAAPGSAQSYIIDNLENGKKYIFKVTVQEHLRPESEGAKIEALAVDNSPPSKPPKLILQPMSGAFSLKLATRQNDPDLKGYLMYVYDDSENLIKNIELTKNFGNFTVSGLRNKYKYKVALTAIDEALNESPEASIEYVIPADTIPPLSIINLKASGTNNKIFIDWAQPVNQHTDIEYQSVNVYDEKKKIVKTLKLAPGVNSYIIDDVLNDYTYKIGITNADGAPNYSKEIITEVTPKLHGGIYDFSTADITLENIKPYIKLTDIYNNGFEDILAIANDNQLIILSNENGKYKKNNTSVFIDNNDFFKTILAEDFNGNGKFDIIILQNGHLKFFRQNTDGKFDDISKYINIFNNGSIKKIFAADFNNDNLKDLLIHYSNNEIGVYNNIGNFNFELQNAEMNISMTDRFSYIFPIDYNNDGFTDLFAHTGFSSGGNKLILLANKKNKFEQLEILNDISFNIFSHTIKDFNMDGSPDIFITFAGAKIGDKILNNLLLLNAKDTGFVFSYKNSPAIDIENNILLTAAADFNIDNNPDLITYSTDNKLRLWKNTKSFIFDESIKFDGKNNISSIVQLLTADIDGDGDTDIIAVFDDKIQIYHNKMNSYKTKKIK